MLPEAVCPFSVFRFRFSIHVSLLSRPFLAMMRANFFHPGKLVWRLPSVGLAGSPAGVDRRVSQAARSAAGSRRGSVVGRRPAQPRRVAAGAGNRLALRCRAARGPRRGASAAGAGAGRSLGRPRVRRPSGRRPGAAAASSRALRRLRRPLRSRRRALSRRARSRRRPPSTRASKPPRTLGRG